MKIKKITIQNFCGIRNGSLDFTEDMKIIGKSESGKSTFLKAFLWAHNLNVSDYIPVDKKSDQISKEPILDIIGDIKVTLEFEHNGKYHKLERIAKHDIEINTTSLVKTYQGTKSASFILDDEKFNGIQLEKRLEAIYNISADQFPVFLIPDFFNSKDMATKTETQDISRRKFLLKPFENAVQEIETKLLINPNFEFIKKELSEGKTIEQVLSKLNQDDKDYKKEIDNNVVVATNYQSKIVEIQSKGIDFNALELSIKELEETREDLLKKNSKARKSDLITEKQSLINDYNVEIASLRTKYQNECFAYNKQIREEKNHLQFLLNEIEDSKYFISFNQQEIELANKKVQTITETIDNKDFKCKECGQFYPVELIDDIIEKNQKQIDIENANIIKLKQIISDLEISKDIKSKSYNDMKKAYDLLVNNEPKEDNKISELENKIQELNTDIDKINNADATSANAIALNKIEELKNQIDIKKIELDSKKILENYQNEIKVLTTKNVELVSKQSIAKQQLVLVKEFNKEKLKLLESSINSQLPQDITFILFKHQYDSKTIANGNEFVETCELCYKGKPYSTLSAGALIEANYLLAVGLRSLYKVDFPIWVDDFSLRQTELKNPVYQRIVIINDKVSELPNVIRF